MALGMDAWKSPMRFRGVALGVGIAAMLLLALFPAAASARHTNTKLGIDAIGVIYPDGNYDWLFAGFVAQRPFGFGCVGHRDVRIFRDVPNAPDTLIGSDRSDFLGGAFITWHHPDLASVPGDYYAKVRHEKKRNKHGTLRCSGAQSKMLTINAPQLHPVATRSAGIALAQAHAPSP